MSDNVMEFRRKEPPIAGNPTDDAFVLGWEFGLVSAQIERGEPFERLVHWENQERIQRSCDDAGRSVEFKATEPPTEGWLVASVK